MDEYFDKLGSTAFRPIHNEVRLFFSFDSINDAL
jgi:hypothetical protein